MSARANNRAVRQYVDALPDAVRRRDGWENARTGTGTSRDKALAGQFRRGVPLTDQVLEDLYGEDDFAQRIVNAPIDEAMKRSFRIGAGPTTTTDEDPAELARGADDQPGDEPDEPGETSDLGEEIRDYLDDWDVDELVSDGASWGRLHGGGGVLVGADDGRAFAEPLDATNIRRIHWLRVLDRRCLSAHSYYGGDSRTPGEIERYYLHPIGLGARAPTDAIVHESRFIRFRGARTTIWQRARLGGWDDSVLRRCYTVLLQAAQNWQSICHLMSDLSQGVFKIRGLAKLVANKRRDVIDERIDIVDRSRSVARAIAIDAEGEEFERKSSELSGVAEIWDRTVQRVAAVAQLPVTILLGQSPSGFDATGQADFQALYDMAERFRRALTRPIKQLVRLLLLAWDGPFGRVARSVTDPLTGSTRTELAPLAASGRALTVTWAPLWQGTTKDRAAEMEAVAKRDALYVQQGILSPHEVALSRFPASGWTSETSIQRALRYRLLRRQRAELDARQAVHFTPPANAAALRPQSPEVGTSEPVGAGAGGETDPLRQPGGAQ